LLHSLRFAACLFACYTQTMSSELEGAPNDMDMDDASESAEVRLERR
jgi:hypothetical protein